MRAPAIRRRDCVCAAAGALLAPGGLAVPTRGVEVRYPPPEVQPDQRGDYPTRLLALALARSGGRYVPVAASTPMAKSRAMLELARGSPQLDVVWAMTDPERESLLLPVRIPIDRGLLGWRLALVRRQDAELLREVRDLSQLRNLAAGQGHDWPDLRILRANGLKVAPVSSYPALFSMLSRGRFDYLPRGIAEVGAELQTFREADLVLDEHIALHYPAAMYFFVNRERPELAAALQRGLEVALQDGSFETLFQSLHGQMLRAAQLQRRHVIELSNPLLPPDTPLHRRELWWTPGDGRSAAAPGPALR